MGRIPEDDVARVREATDITQLVGESVVLKKRGRLLWGLCPFHTERTPSFKIDPSSQLWYCFGCAEGGDAISFIMKTEHLEFAEAIRKLADRARIEITEEVGGVPDGARSAKDRLTAALGAAAEYYHQVLTSSHDSDAQAAREYLAGRGFGSEVARRHTIGYAPSARGSLSETLRSQGFTTDELVTANLSVRDDRGGLKDRFFNRIMFPIQDVTGKVIGFGGRVLGDGSPKYLNTQETPVFHKSAALYGLYAAKGAIVRAESAVVVEGYTDVIALREAGVETAVATLGTALTERHVHLLARFAKRVVFLFDGDAAGIKAATRAGDFISLQTTPEAAAGKVEFAVAVIPGGADPAEFVAEHGADAVQQLIAGAEPLLRFLLDRRIATFDLSSPEGRSGALHAAAEVLAGVRDSVIVQGYANQVANTLTAAATGHGGASLDHATVMRAIRQAVLAPTVFDAAADGESSGASAAPVDGAGRPRDLRDAVEREVLGLLAVEPGLRGQARELLTEDAFLAPQRGVAFSAIVASDALGAALVHAVARVAPDVARVMPGWLMDAGSAEDVESQFRESAARLHEVRLMQRIRELEAAMDSEVASADTQRQDVQFQELFALQVELERWRQGRNQ